MWEWLWNQETVNESLKYLEDIGHRIQGFEGTQGENLQENKDYWRKGDLCYFVAESLSTLWPEVMWEIENVANELADL